MGINGWIQSMIIQMEEKPMRIPTNHSKIRHKLKETINDDANGG